MRFIETWIPATLVSTRDLSPGIREFLIRPDQFDGAAYPVGSHINVSVTIDGQPETRSYSLVGEASSARLQDRGAPRRGFPRRLALHVAARSRARGSTSRGRPRSSRSTGRAKTIA